jgi:hypothetical protein
MQSCDSVKKLEPMSECCNAKFLQVLERQARKDGFVNRVLAECRLILPEAKAP